jgi:NAD(P)-dependent dehydrogenase (short-subunit alcohol dehydrogenase family)
MNRVALVTGGGGGMGEATVARLAGEGAVVYALDINPESVDKLAAEHKQHGHDVRALHGDVTVSADLDAAFSVIRTEQGRLDVLVDIAGGSMAGLVSELADEDWERYYRLNVLSTVMASRRAIDLMKSGGGGSIVVMSSISGVRGDPGWAVYNTTKAALINFTECLAWEVGRDGIRVNAICPGPIKSKRMIDSLPDDKFVNLYNDSTALGRMGEPEEVASAIAFLASDDAAFVTGAHLVADGGLTARTGQPIVPPA